MPSENKTQNYELNQWGGNEYLKREDLNNDNLKIDAAIKDVDNKKVDKVTGKGLSTNDFTNTHKTKVDNIPASPKYTDTTYGVVTTSTNGLMSSTDKTKINGIATGANNYTHPSSHPASIITESTDKRFVSDSEKATWNNKVDLEDYAQEIASMTNTADLSLRGYFKDEKTGFIIQWGEITMLPGEGYTTATYRIPFPNRTIRVLSSPRYASNTGSLTVICTVDNYPTATECVIYARNPDGSPINEATGIGWLAIGR